MRFFVQLDDGTQVPICSLNELEGVDKTKEIIFCLSDMTVCFGHYAGLSKGFVMIDTHVDGKLIIPSNLVFGWFYKEG